MARDPRPIGDWSRQFDSVFKPRQNLPGSRRGRYLVVFAAFLLVESAFIIQLMSAGQPLGIGWWLWGIWLAFCLGLTFLPQLGAANDAPGHQRIARMIFLGGMMLGLAVTALGRVTSLVLPDWWPLVAVSVIVAASAGVLGVLEWRSVDK